MDRQMTSNEGLLMGEAGQDGGEQNSVVTAGG